MESPVKLPKLAVGSLLVLASLAPAREAHPSLIVSVSHNVDVSLAAGTQNETTVAVDPTDPLHMIAASNDWGDAFGAKVYESVDGGRTWEVSFTPPVPHACYDPWVDFNAVGDAFFAYECVDQRIAYKKADQTAWTDEVLMSSYLAPDRDMVVVDSSPLSPFYGSVYIGFDENADVNSGHVLYSRTGFDGWAKSPKINDQSRTIGVNAAVGPDGTLYATWLDFDQRRLMVDRSTDGGVTWETDHRVTRYRLDTTNFWVFIPPSPDRGLVPMPFGAVAPDGSPSAGRLYVTYTDRSVSADDTDIFVRYSDDGGLTWSSERRVNDDAGDSYQFHPRIAVAADGTVAVAFYDTRNDPANEKTDTYVAFSTDGGTTWSANRKVTTAQSDQVGGADEDDYGDYQGIDAISGNRFQVVWGDSRPGTVNEDVATATVSPRQTG
jgi:hypothetical protein